jgi:hypothetical protein
MKVLLYITGYKQLKEYEYFNVFFEKTKRLKEICDIFIYCNNAEISQEIVSHYHSIKTKNKFIYITTLNAGFCRGGIEAVSEGMEKGFFRGYDYVIHLHPDVFITDETYLIKLLEDNLTNKYAFFVTRFFPNNYAFAFDFFFFKPALLKENIFKEQMYSYPDDIPEHYLHDMIRLYNVPFKYVKRFNNDDFFPRRIDDNLKLWHEHNMTLVEKYIRDNVS